MSTTSHSRTNQYSPPTNYKQILQNDMYNALYGDSRADRDTALQSVKSAMSATEGLNDDHDLQKIRSECDSILSINASCGGLTNYQRKEKWMENYKASHNNMSEDEKLLFDCVHTPNVRAREASATRLESKFTEASSAGRGSSKVKEFIDDIGGLRGRIHKDMDEEQRIWKDIRNRWNSRFGSLGEKSGTSAQPSDPSNIESSLGRSTDHSGSNFSSHSAFQSSQSSDHSSSNVASRSQLSDSSYRPSEGSNTTPSVQKQESSVFASSNGYSAATSSANSNNGYLSSVPSSITVGP